MKRFLITLALMLFAVSVSAQPRMAPPKVTTLTGLRGNQGDIVNLVGTGDYMCFATTCTSSGDWKIIASGTVSTLTCAQYGVAFAATADTLGCDADLTFNDSTNTITLGTTATSADVTLQANNTGGFGFVIKAAPDSASTDASYLSLIGGAATVSGSDGGEIDIDGGPATAGDGGAIALHAGNSVDGDAGNVSIAAGNSTTGDGGDVTILSGNGAGGVGQISLQTNTGLATLTLSGAGVVTITGTLADLDLQNGSALRTDTTTAHTALLQAYDTDTGPGYVTFATFTNGTAPSLVIAPPAGGGTVSGNFTTLQVGGVTTATRITGSGTIDFGSIADGACLQSNITVTGAADGDMVAVGGPAALADGLFVTGKVSATSTVRIQVCNLSGGAVDPASGTFSAMVIR